MLNSEDEGDFLAYTRITTYKNFVIYFRFVTRHGNPSAG